MKLILIDDGQSVCMSLKIILEADASIQVAAIGMTAPKRFPYAANTARMYY